MRNKLIVYVEGGNIQEVRTSKPEETDVYVFDVDNLRAEGLDSAAIDKKYDQIVTGTEQIEYV